jgi:CheY-like chemotaxis protein
VTKTRKTTGVSHARRSRRRDSRRKPKAALVSARSVDAVETTASDLPRARAPVVVAVLNSNQDVLRLIRSTLEDEGYTVATAHIISFKEGEANLAQFLSNHRPAVIVYDVAPPYKENWNFLQLLREIPQVADIPMVLTTVNKAALEDVVGSTDAFEILGTRDNLAPLVDGVNRSARSRPEPLL